MHAPTKQPAPAPGAKFRLPEWAKYIPNSFFSRLKVIRDVDGAQMDDPEIVHTVFLRARWKLVLGRNPSLVDEVLDHSTVSREHAAICFNGSIFRIIDLESSQGTNVNNHPLPPNQWFDLRDGDRIQLADSQRVFVCAGMTLQYSRVPVQPAFKPKTRGTKRGREVQELPPSDPSYPQIHCLHILVKHRESRHPSSWRSKSILRRKEDAQELANGYRESLLETPDNFAEYARSYSDCGSAKRGGDLGWFGRGKMHKQFEDAAFALEVSQISEPVLTDSGYHLIIRLE